MQNILTQFVMKRFKTIKIQFNGGSDAVLDARLDLPVDAPKAFAIFCHCFTCTKETLAAFRISRLLAEQGIAVLRFDFTGLGSSNGDFAETNFTTMVDDIMAAAEYLSLNYQAPSLLLGHSMGGTAALTASLQLKEVTGIVTIASPSKPEHVLHHFGPALTELENNIPTSFKVAGQMYRMNPQFVSDIRSYDTQKTFKEITKPVLVFNVLNDGLVAQEDAQEIERWVGGITRIVTLEDADHLISDNNDAAQIVDEIIAWLPRNEK